MIIVQAYVNWGRWVADCSCAMAYRVDNFPSALMCKACGEEMQIEYPPNREAIEAVLAHRPGQKAGSQIVFSHRNWRPGESIVALRRENREHGLSDRGG